MKNLNKIAAPYLSQLLLLGLMVTYQSGAGALPNSESLKAEDLEAIFKQQFEPEENVQLQSRLTADIDPAVPGLEQLVIWTKLGATYWSNHLSVLARQGQQWKSLATLSLDGSEARLLSVAADGLITVNVKSLATDDPLCCPSQSKTLHYRYRLGHLFEVKTTKKDGDF